MALGKFLRGRRDPCLELLDAAGWSDGPAAVAEVALELASDRGYGVRQEILVAEQVEAFNRLDQSEVGDLLKVREWDATVPVAPRHTARYTHVGDDDFAAKRDDLVFGAGAGEFP
jgi:hypothetical protein